MGPKVDAKHLLAELERKKERTKVSFYLSKPLYEEFKRFSGKVPASQVLQKLMEVFVEDAAKQGLGRRKAGG